MTPYVYEGCPFDLDVTYIDVVGVEWRWIGLRNDAGEPLMLGAGDRTPIPLRVVYLEHGPLIALNPQPHASHYRAAIDPDYAASVAGGFVESLADYELRLGGAT